MKVTRRLCWNCLEDIRKAGIRYERLNGTTGRMDKCEGCGKRRLIEEYVIEIRGRERANQGESPTRFAGAPLSDQGPLAARVVPGGEQGGQ